MTCKEEPGLDLEDGAERIFLNTRGANPEEVSPELVELLHYMENTNTAAPAESQKVREIQKRVEAIKSSEEVGVRYMQAWEEKVLERQAGRQEGRLEGLREKLKEQTAKKWQKGKTPEQAAEDLEEDPEVIREIYKELEQESKTRIN